MLLIYNIGLQLYFYAVYVAAFFNKKARLWIDGRKNKNYIKFTQSTWFHFASLGEFEQGRPVLEAFKQTHAGKKIVITFFSPSGYEIRKNTSLADAVYYLPLDTAANASQFIDAIRPDMAVFTKYEYWYHFFNELHKRNIPLYIISGIFRPKQVFFKWYGSLHRKILSFATYFFVQDERSKLLLQNIGINTSTVSGDTRFDRVWTNAQNPKELPLMSEFTKGHKVFIAGSTWPADEKILSSLIIQYPDWKFIIAPHEISEERINKLVSMLVESSCIKYSQLTSDGYLDFNSLLTTHHSLIIDNIGILSSMYQYGDIAYIGGGFGVGIHNTLEAAAFGLPVIFGPNYHKFKEAVDLVNLKAGFSINNEVELKTAVSFLIDDKERSAISKKIKDYVQANTGATETIMGYMNVKSEE
jgi:3-deoxy-D-manno-octulosonic-acid transferase